MEEVGRDVIVLEILGRNAERIALHTRVDVFGDEDRALSTRMEIVRDAEDAVVGLVEIEREISVRAAPRNANRAALFVPDDTLEKRPLRAKSIERARDMPRISAAFIVVFLERVELFDHREWDHHFVLGEFENRLRVVEEDVGVKHKVLARRRSRRLGAGEAFGHDIRAILIQHASPPMAGTALSYVTPQG